MGAPLHLRSGTDVLSAVKIKVLFLSVDVLIKKWKYRQGQCIGQPLVLLQCYLTLFGLFDLYLNLNWVIIIISTKKATRSSFH